MMPPESSFLELCRLCLVKDNVSTLIFDRKDDEAIHIKISACLPVKVKDDDGLPNKICDECVCKLENTYQFRHVAASSEKQLLQWLSDTKSRENPSVNIPSENNGSEKNLVKQEIVKGNDSRNSENQNCNEEHESSESDADAVVVSTGKPQGNAADPTDVTPSLNESLQVVTPAGAVVQQPTFLLVGNAVGVPILQLAPPSLLQPGVPLQLKPCTSGFSREKCSKNLLNNLQTELQEKMAESMDIVTDQQQESLQENNLLEEVLIPDIKIEHEVADIYTCPKCFQMFETDEALCCHMATHLWTDSGQYKCGVCDSAFDSARALRAHKRLHKENEFKEEKPDVSIPTAGKLEKEPYWCDGCCLGFETLHKFHAHRRSQHSENTRYVKGKAASASHTRSNFTCEMCGKILSSRSALVDHRNAHTGERPFQCPSCERSYSQRTSLLTHIKTIHRACPPPRKQCELCGRTFSTAQGLLLHKNTHTGELSYTCEWCGKSLSNKEHLKLHHRIHTGEKPYECPTCGKAFSKGSNLKLHVRTHTGEKPYVCDVCEKAFSQRSTLVIHRRYHTGQRPYVCVRCDRAFVCKGLLTVHQKNCHD